MNTATTHTLTETLANLEQELETPVIPGEQSTWVEQIEKACQPACEAYHDNVRENHEELLEAIGNQSELLSRVDQLRLKDSELSDRWHRLVWLAGRLAEIAQDAEPDEGKFDEHVEQLDKEALQLILDTRAQEQALTTWYMEAMNRVQGDGD